ncbi:hypothetical protein BRADI_1g49847v3 [Brachypodium distachyon]|uniref:Uncharacterized protein n=2 Tax=Brachypodium distachyon TaxID=15368 RepID=A0A2K2DQM9_BRADI|nr:hypothetical protein BRADI_1g49847v3 [Brachypodium distachyon]
MHMFNGGSAKPTEVEFLTTLPTAVAPRSPRSANSFSASSPVKEHGGRVDIDWMDMFSCGSAEPPEFEFLPSLPAVVAPRSTRPAESFCVSSHANPVKKHGGRVDIDWMDMFNCGSAESPEFEFLPSPPSAVAPRSARPAESFCVSSNANPVKKHKARVDIDWMDMFNGRSAEPPEVEFSSPLPTAVAPRSARLAESFCVSSHANPVKKHGARVDIDWMEMFIGGSTELPEVDFSSPARGRRP